MSGIDYTAYVNPETCPRLTKAQARMSFDSYPPFLEPLLGMWAPLSRQPFVGVTTDGVLQPGLFEHAAARAPTEAAAKATLDWLASLTREQRDQVCFPVASDAWRAWQNTPLRLREPQLELESLSPVQRALALEVVRVSLSPDGYARTRQVMANNLFLGRLVGLTELLNEWAFTLSVFGEPSTAEPWGWQLFGHHLALNCLFAGDRMVLSPVFMGLEPDHSDTALQRRMFEPHEKAALGLMGDLSDTERRQAVLYSSMRNADQPSGRFHPDDGRQVGGAYQDNRRVPYEGVNVGALGRAQQHRLLGLAELFIQNMPDGPAAARLNEIERHLGQTHFAWVGPADNVNPFYFRIHSPVALIEFDHHAGIFLSNQDPLKFHVHTIVRTPNGGDYGADLLSAHYAAGGHERHHHHHQPGPGGAHSHDGGDTFHRHD